MGQDSRYIERLGFKKTEKDNWIGWHDYLLEDMNPKYPYFLKATLHYPRKPYLESDNIEHRCWKIILHRNYSVERMEQYLEDGESKVVYVGLIESEEDLKFILTKTGVIGHKRDYSL